MIIIFSIYEDAHARAVAWALGRCGEKSVVVDTPAFPARGLISQTHGSGETTTTFSMLDAGEQVVVRDSEVKAVWHRRFNDKVFDLTGLHSDDARAARRECRRFVESLREHFTLLPTARQFNPRAASLAVASKLQQLIEAEKVGLRIPETLVSNAPGDIRTFFRAHGERMVMKPLAPERWEENGRTFIQQTALITRENAHLLTDETLARCPAIYQAFVAKDHELRITYFNGAMHAARIETSKDPRASVDSKGGLFQTTPVTACTIDAGMARGITDFCRATGLAFGCFDIAVESSGDATFLEVNEQGQFLWLERFHPEADLLRRFVAMLLDVEPIELPELRFDDFRASDAERRRPAYETIRNARYESNAKHYGLVY